MNSQTILSVRISDLQEERFNDSEFAAEYAVKHSKMSLKFARKISALLSKRNFLSGKILDTGCGSGLTLIELAKRFSSSECYGIDLSDPLLEIANNIKKKEKLTDRVKFLKADVQDIPFPNEYFDLVINLNMLHLVKDPVKMLNEIKRVLKSDRFFFITDLRKSILGFIEREIKSSFTIEETKEIIEKSNLSNGKLSSELIFWGYQNL
jgi:ubiquinone/menaquinone biosynthesis C-methylase UbiE